VAEYSVTLRKESQADYNAFDYQGFRMQVEVIAAQGLSPKIFVYRASTQLFSHIASPSDLVEYPDSGDPLDDSVYYREDKLDLVFRSGHLAADAWQAILSDITGLVESLKASESVISAEEITISTES